MNTNIVVREIKDSDWKDIMALQNEAYDSIEPETLEVFKSKSNVSPETCFIAEYKGQFAGYFLSLPYPEFEIPSMIESETKAHQSLNLHMHDIAVKRSFQKKSIGQALINKTIETADMYGYKILALIALKHAVGFWKSKGFIAQNNIMVPKYYGDGAVYMRQDIDELKKINLIDISKQK